MILVISQDIQCHQETLLSPLFWQQPFLLHLRDYSATAEDLALFIERIPTAYRDRLVLHQHPQIAKELGIHRLHFNTPMRQQNKHLAYKSGYMLSTSTHSMDEFNQLEPFWAYAFLSPFFPSISKFPYGKDSSMLPEVKNRSNLLCPLIALGGLSPDNILTAMQAGADGSALLGTIWQAPDPIAQLEKCVQIYQSYDA